VPDVFRKELTDKIIMIPYLLKSFVILTLTVAFPVLFIPSLAVTSTQNATLVTDAPETTITSAIDGNGTSLPLSGGAVTSSNSITISFNGTDNVGISGFQCSLDGQPAAACGTPGSNSSSVTLSNLAAGTHTFMVRAIDTSGNPDPTPATFTWTITQTSPTPIPTPTPTPTPNLCPINQLQLVIQLIRDIQGLNPQVAFAIAPALNTLQALLSSNCGLGNTITPTFTNPTPFGIFANSNQNNNNNNVKAAACNLLNEFTNQVNIRTEYRQITPSQAAYLIGQSSPHSAQQIAKQLGCLLAGSSISNNNNGINNNINNNNNDQTARLMLFNRGIPTITTTTPNANNPSLPFMNSQQRQQFLQLPQQIPQIPSQPPSHSAAIAPPQQHQQQPQSGQHLVQQGQQAQLPFYPYPYGHYP
jgi:Bacterial Ig domain